MYDEDAMICARCCGETREMDKCAGCSFYKPPANDTNYRSVPHYSVEKMSTFRHLQTLFEQVEYALCGFDNQSNEELTDKDLLQLLELVFDKYYFMVSEPDNLYPAARQRLDKITTLFGKELPTRLTTYL